MLYKRIILLGIIMIGFFGGVIIHNNVDAQNVNSLCSTSLRGNSPSHTPQSLYQPDQFKINYMIATNAISNSGELSQPSITGNIAWHNNFSNCSPDNPTLDEKNFRESRRNSYKTLPSINIAVVNDDVSIANAKQLQQFINISCALNLVEDGEIGIKTLNAIKYCKPPALGYLSWSQFQTMYSKLYFDIIGTQAIYVNNQFQGDPSQKLYFKQSDFPSQPTSPGLGLVQTGSITNGTSAIAGTSSIADINSTAICRFKPQDGVVLPQEYTNAIANGYEAGDCTTGCKDGYTEVKKGGISVCEKCDLKKCNCGIKLNTNIPFIGRCIMNQQTNNVGQTVDGTTVNSLNAFPILMGALIKLLMSIIMIVCFASLIVGGFMMTVPDQYDTGKGIVKKVIRTIVALGSLGTILYLINPNFFF